MRNVNIIIGVTVGGVATGFILTMRNVNVNILATLLALWWVLY